MRMDYIDELFQADDDKTQRIESLLRTSLLDPEQREEIDRELMSYMDAERAEELIQYLYENQVDPITSGLNYGQKDIIKHQRKLK